MLAAPTTTPTATFTGQFYAVARKNVLYKLRNRKHTLLEIAWPVYFVVILALTILPSLKSPTNSPPGCTGESDNKSCAEPLPKGIQLFGFGGECQSVVLFAPNSSAHTAVMADALALLGEEVSDPTSGATGCPLGFASRADLEDAYVSLNSSAPHPNAIDAVRAAVFLPEDLVGPTLSYTIAAPPNPGGRWRSTNYDGTLGEAPSSYGNGLRFELDLANGGSDGSAHNQANSAWKNWLSLQWAVDHALGLAVADATKAATFRADPPPLPLLGKLPLSPFDAPYAPGAVGSGLPGAVGGALSYILPIYLVWGNTICVAYIANLVVSEREKKLVDGMQVMGLSPLVGWLGWWSVFGLQHTISATVTTVGATASGMFPNSSPLVLWITMELYTLAMIAASFVISAIFKTAKPAQGGAFLAYASGFGLFALSVGVGTPAALQWPLLLDVFVAGPTGVLQFLLQEQWGGGMTFATLTDGETPLLAVWLFLLLDTLLYIALARYIEEVRHKGRACCFPCAALLGTFGVGGGGRRATATRTTPPGTPLQSCSCRGSGALLHAEPATDADAVDVAAAAAAAASADAAGAATDEGAARRGVAVSMRALSKTFPPDGKTKAVCALESLTLDMYEGEVTALLGQNGAGKTTAIGILTGLHLPSGGEARVFGHDVRTQMSEIRALAGVCPQHDLLFDVLSVQEHLRLFGQIKGVPVDQASSEATRWLGLVGLGGTLAQRAGTLSGGQKRKLSVAIAMVGEPAFVLLDEPTAGMDPESRRAIWELVLAARAGRSIVLTTHFMDEADALSDRIAIIAKAAGKETGGGTLRCVDTSLGLKTRWGSGYQLRFALGQASASAAAAADDDDADKRAAPLARAAVVDADGVGNDAGCAALLALAQEHVRGATEHERQPRELCVSLPQEQRAAFPALFEALTPAVLRQHGALSYGIALPSLQEVFLRVVEGGDVYQAPSVAAAGEGGEGGEADEARSPLTTGPSSSSSPADGAGGAAGGTAPASFAEQLRLTGWLWVWQSRAEWKGAALIYALSVVMMCVGFVVPVAVRPSGGDGASAHHPTPPTLELSVAPLGDDEPYWPLPYAPGAGAAVAALQSLHTTPDEFSLEPQPAVAPTTANVTAAVRAMQRATRGEANHGVGSFGGLVLQPTAAGLAANGTACLFNSSWPNVPPMLLNLLDQASVRTLLSPPDTTLATSFTELPYGALPADDGPTFDVSQILAVVLPPTLLSLGCLFVTMVPAVALVQSRQTKCKHQLQLMGLDVRAYWTAQFLTQLLPVGLFLLLPLMVAAAATGAVCAAAFPAFLLACLCACPPIILFGFLISFAFSTKEGVSGFYTMFYMVLCFMPTIVINALQGSAKAILTYATLIIPVNQLIASVRCVLWVQEAAAIAAQYTPPGEPPPPGPSVSDFFVLTFDMPAQSSDGSTERLTGPVACVVASLGSFALYALAIYLIDVRLFLHPPSASAAAPAASASPTAAAAEDEDVASERARVEAAALGAAGQGSLVASSTGDWLTACRLRKVYGGRTCTKDPAARTDKVAVDALSFGVAPGTCFALLGPNGAGKTTAIGMLTGDAGPTSGDAWICGLSVRTQLTAIYRRTGFCPQFGGLFEKLTLRHHLATYMRLKGVADPGARLAACQAVEANFGLTEHAHKPVDALSGGTKRKLSAAIAIACGRPDVVFLDEPTTGVDASTRRFIWDRIREGRPGRVVLLTTHYMDEADALAQSIGVMAAGKLQVLGSPQHLKSRHGGGYRIELNGPAAAAPRVAELVRELCAGATALEQHAGAQAFEVDAALDMPRAFRALEGAKAEQLLHNYSLSQTTLEQVFLNVAKRAGTPAGA